MRILRLSYFLFAGLGLTALSCQPGVWSQEEEAKLLWELTDAIDRSAVYDSAKEAEILRLQVHMQGVSPDSGEAKLAAALALFEAYQLYRYDSAFFYVQTANRLAHQLADTRAIARSRIRFGTIFVSAGLYKEALDSLGQVKPAGLERRERAGYHGLMGRCYGDMAEFADLEIISSRYRQMARFHRDSALVLADSGSFFRDFLRAYLPSTNGETQLSYLALQNLLRERPHHPRDLALLHYVLGDLAIRQNKPAQAVACLAKAAQIDIETSAKENLAIFRLASVLFDQGNSRLASRLIRKAHEDARFFGARQRQWQVGEILPFIEARVIATIETQSERLLFTTLLVSVLLLFSGVLVWVIYRQMKRLRHARDVISEAHAAQQRINEQLQEANRIKEEYIGFFFHRDVQLTELLEKLKAEVDQKLTEKDWPEIRSLLKNRHFRDQREQLLNEFDVAFMRLFPRFVAEFNALFPPENQLTLRDGEGLTTELRIYALLRLGVTANEKIAQILGYSVNTVYMYKSRVRKRSTLPADEFDRALMARITFTG
jgi:tetratricopeptide (TPR) repeat protein